jgi:hypothetical protein
MRFLFPLIIRLLIIVIIIFNFVFTWDRQQGHLDIFKVFKLPLFNIVICLLRICMIAFEPLYTTVSFIIVSFREFLRDLSEKEDEELVSIVLQDGLKL